jgi:hypothetical protein
MTSFVKVVVIEGVEYLVEEKVEHAPVEFRLYYDDNGNTLFVTCEKPEGNYVIIDKESYLGFSLDWKVRDGKLIKKFAGIRFTKLVPKNNNGVACSVEDVNLIVSDSFEPQQKWDLKIYEL